MHNLDLVITPDSSLAHLAGALAVPIWVATPLASDWRWLTAREDSPWYPTMRLFRQRTWGGWPDVFERMASALAVEIAKRVTNRSRGAGAPCPRPAGRSGHAQRR